MRRLIYITAALGFGIAANGATSAQDINGPDTGLPTSRIIVELTQPEPGSLITADTRRNLLFDRHFGSPDANLDAGTVRITHIYSDPLIFAADVDFATRYALENDDRVARVIDDSWHRPSSLNIAQAIGAAPLHAEGIDGSGVVIAQFDTGVDLDHPFYSGNLIDGACFSTPRENGTSLCPNGEATMVGPMAAAACEGLPECAHGTAMAGIMVGSNDTNTGVAPGASLLPIQVFTRMSDTEICGPTDCLVAWASDLIMARRHVELAYRDSPELLGAVFFGFADLPHRAEEITSPDPDLCTSFQVFGTNFTLDEIPYVAPTGNDGSYTRFLGVPCADLWPIQALGSDGEVAEFSNTWRFDGATNQSIGGVPALSAPGVGVASSTLGGEFSQFSGTSVSAAQVAGAAALLRSHYRYLPDTIWLALRMSGDRVLDRRMNFDITSIHIDDAVDWLTSHALGVYTIRPNFLQPAHATAESAGYGFGPAIKFVGNQGGPFQRALRGLAPPDYTFRFSGPEALSGQPLSVTVDVPWITIEAPSQTARSFEVNVDINSEADILSVGFYEATLTITVDGVPPMQRQIWLSIGAPNTHFENAQTLIGYHDTDLSSHLGAEIDPASESLGLNANLQTLWWRWIAPEDGHYLFRALRDGVSAENRIVPVHIFSGISKDALTPITSENRCLFRFENAVGSATDISNGVFHRFEAQAGQEYRFAVQEGNSQGHGAITVSLEQALMTGYETRETARTIHGSNIDMPVALHGADARCVDRYSASHYTGAYAANGDAWLRWTPDVTGTHAVRISHASRVPVYDDILRSGSVSVYLADGVTLIARFNGAEDVATNGVYEAFANVEANQDYLIHIDAFGVYGTRLEIEAPDRIQSPENDDFAFAIVLTASDSTIHADNHYATREAGDPDSFDAGRSLWWRVTPQSNGLLYVTNRYTPTTSRGLNFRIFSGSDYDQLAYLGTGDLPTIHNGSSVSYSERYMPVSAGESYYFRADGFEAPRYPAREYGPFQLRVAYGVPPANDDFENAIRVDDGNIETAGRNSFATMQDGESIEPGQSDFMRYEQELGVWYLWTAPDTGLYRFAIGSYDINPQISIYQGNALSSLNLVANASHTGGGPPGMIPFGVSFEANAGEEYRFRVSSYQFQMGEFRFTIRPTLRNDDRRNATIIYTYPFSNEVIQAPFSEVIDTNLASDEPDEPQLSTVASGGSVWYAVVRRNVSSPYPTIAIDTSGSSIDTVVSMLGAGDALENDDFAPEFGVTSSRLEFEMQFATSVVFRVAGKDGQRGDVRVNIGEIADMVPRMRTALLPTARAGQVGAPLTAFVTFLNAGRATALNCGIELANPTLPIDLEFRPTDPSTNQISGDPGELRPAEVLRPVTYLVALTPREALAPSQVELVYSCDDGANTAPVTPGVNTFLISSDIDAPPDILAIAATVGNTGIAGVPISAGAGFFTAAAANIGTGDSITFSANTGSNELPLTLEVCETDISQGGACISERSSSLTLNMLDDRARTFAIFARATDIIEFNPSQHRIFAEWRDSDGIVRGATSVAVRTN